MNNDHPLNTPKYYLTRLRGHDEHKWTVTRHSENEWWEVGGVADTWDEAIKIRDQMNAAMPPRKRKK